MVALISQQLSKKRGRCNLGGIVNSHHLHLTCRDHHINMTLDLQHPLASQAWTLSLLLNGSRAMPIRTSSSSARPHQVPVRARVGPVERVRGRGWAMDLLQTRRCKFASDHDHLASYLLSACPLHAFPITAHISLRFLDCSCVSSFMYHMSYFTMLLVMVYLMDALMPNQPNRIVSRGF